MGRVSLFWMMLVAVVAAGNCAPISGAEKYDVLEPRPLFEGDIAGVAVSLDLEPDASIARFIFDTNRNGIVKGRWPGNKMYYHISDFFTKAERQLIIGAITAINVNASNFEVLPRTTQDNYVFIGRGAPRTGCWSYVGQIGGAQQLNLEVSVNASPHCMHHGIIAHELLHAVGFYHEQSRTDRDNHVEINWSNIQENQQHNFVSYSSTFVTAFQQPYDYDSLMHYGRYDFAVNRTVWTIRAKAPRHDIPIGQRRGLSAIDIAKLNAMYPAATQG